MLKFVNAPPTEVSFSSRDEDAVQLDADAIEQIAEIFNTPLTGSYAWDYRAADRQIAKLYRLGKERNWNAEQHIDWSRTFPHDRLPVLLLPGFPDPYAGWEPYEALGEAGKVEFGWHSLGWMISQFLHGEQGALLVSSQLVSCAPTYEAKLYASSQTFDEARHVEVFGRYLREKVGITYPVNVHLKSLLDKVLTDPRWDLKFIGMQLVIESLALAAFHVQRATTADPLLRDIIDYVLRDEARHVAFGVTYMRQHVASLSQEEVAFRARFAFEACRVMRERIVPTDIYVHYGFDPDEGRRRFLAAGEMDTFRNLLFTRIMPNLNAIGLLTDEIKPSYEALGLMQFAGLPDDTEIDWAQLAAPLPYDEMIAPPSAAPGTPQHRSGIWSLEGQEHAALAEGETSP